jgi:hypothetical protein
MASRGMKRSTVALLQKEKNYFPRRAGASAVFTKGRQRKTKKPPSSIAPSFIPRKQVWEGAVFFLIFLPFWKTPRLQGYRNEY